MQIVTATELKRNMKEILAESLISKEPIIIKRPHGHDMALIELSEYESLKETAYLLGNEANAAHLMDSLRELKTNKIIKKKFEDLQDK